MNVYCLKPPWTNISLRKLESSVSIELKSGKVIRHISSLHIEIKDLPAILDQIFDFWHPCGEIKGEKYTEYSDRRGNQVIDDNLEIRQIEDLEKMKT